MMLDNMQLESQKEISRTEFLKRNNQEFLHLYKDVYGHRLYIEKTNSTVNMVVYAYCSNYEGT